jgi:hypothetical protein
MRIYDITKNYFKYYGEKNKMCSKYFISCNRIYYFKITFQPELKKQEILDVISIQMML